MDAIWQKIKADIINRPLVSALIMITIVTSAALLTLALATLRNISAPYNQMFEELNAAHLWLYFDRDRISSRDIKRIEALPGIVGSTRLRYSVLSRVRVHDTQVWTSLRAIPTEEPAVNRLLIQEGRSLAPHREELLVSKDLDYLYQLPVGDRIGIVRDDGKEIDLPIVGMAYNPMWDIYRNSQPPYIYLSESSLRSLFPDESTWNWSMGVRLADPYAVDEMMASIEKVLRSDSIESHTDWRDVRESAIFEVQLNLVFLSVFSFFAILASILVIASSVSSIVLSQFRQIGILKTIGFTQNQITWLYLGENLLLSLIGAPLGLLLGIVLSPLPLQSAAVSLSTTFRPPISLFLIVTVLIIVPTIVAAAAWGAARRGARGNVIKAITTGMEAPSKKTSRVVKLAARLRLPIPMTLGLNDVFVKPLRSFLTGLNLMLGVMGIVCGLTLNETLVAYKSDPTLLGIAYDAVVSREETSDSRTRHLLRRAVDVKAYYSECLVEAKTREGKTFRVRAAEGDLSAFPFRMLEGGFFRPHTHEAIAGPGLLNWLGLSVGDELTVTLGEEENRPVTWQIVGRYSERSNAGEMLMVDLEAVTRVLRHIEPHTYYLKLKPEADTARLKRYLAPDSDSDLGLSFVGLSVPDTVVYLQLAIFALAAILIGVALINVFNTSLLAVQEKLKVIGILKTVGMSPAQVVTMINTTAGVLGFLAVGVGFPLGMVFTQGMMAALSRSYGFGGLQVSLNSLYLLLLIPLIVGISVAGSFAPGWWAARRSIVQVIRNE